MTRQSLKTILVAIEHPFEARQAGLAKAAALAKQLGARLRLFNSCSNPYPSGLDFYRSTLDDGVAKTLAKHAGALEKLARPLRRRGLNVSVTAVWDFPAYDAIVREALREKTDLVVAENHRRGFGARLLLANTDWQLIRLCPTPLLFVKRATPWEKPRILAAVDPMHANDKPARLDQRILDIAQMLANAHGGRLEVVHGYVPLSSFVAGPLGEPAVVTGDPRLEKQHQARLKRALDRLVAPLNLPSDRIHLRLGASQNTIATVAKQQRASLVVMGAVSRRGIDRIFIGSTAERAIDRLDCDVLVIKPQGFKTPVPRGLRPSRRKRPVV